MKWKIYRLLRPFSQHWFVTINIINSSCPSKFSDTYTFCLTKVMKIHKFSKMCLENILKINRIELLYSWGKRKIVIPKRIRILWNKGIRHSVENGHPVTYYQVHRGRRKIEKCVFRRQIWYLLLSTHFPLPFFIFFLFLFSFFFYFLLVILLFHLLLSFFLSRQKKYQNKKNK